MRKNAQKCAKKCAKKCAFSWGADLSGQKVRDRWTYFQQKGDIWNQHKIANLLIPNFPYFGDQKNLVTFFTMKKICFPFFFHTDPKTTKKKCASFPKKPKKNAQKNAQKCAKCAFLIKRQKNLKNVQKSAKTAERVSPPLSKASYHLKII